MKTNNKVDISKRTKGQYTYTNGNNSDYFDIDCDGNRIASIMINPELIEVPEEYEANAAYICLAVNNFEKLVEALKRMLKWKYCYDLRPEEIEPFEIMIKESERLLKLIENEK